MEKYNGYTNRSTWLARLHLDNTEVCYKNFEELKEKYKSMCEYWDQLKRIDSSTYSYPFHQHKAIEQNLKNLLKLTTINTELNYRFREIDIRELLTD